jgi:lipoyl(octanoyl) transferase
MKFINCGVVEYPMALINMEIAVENVANGEEECIFFMEHETMYSAGKSYKSEDFLGISIGKVYYPNRGGRVTIHSEGQLIIYPIVNLRNRKINISQYISILEMWIITVLKEYGVQGYVSEKGRGVWVNNSKIAFVGVRIENGISSHGISLNVSNDLELFNTITPCGIQQLSLTSLTKIIRKKIVPKEVAIKFKNMAELFF